MSQNSMSVSSDIDLATELIYFEFGLDKYILDVIYDKDAHTSSL